MHLTSSLHQHEHSTTGVPSLQFPIRKPATQQEVSCRQAGFICIDSHCPSLTLPPELRLLSDQHMILKEVQILLWAVHARDLVCSFLMRIIPKPLPTSSPWKNCLHKTGPWCPKGGGLLLYGTPRYSLKPGYQCPWAICDPTLTLPPTSCGILGV